MPITRDTPPGTPRRHPPAGRSSTTNNGFFNEAAVGICSAAHDRQVI
jgi:hypothetical protein